MKKMIKACVSLALISGSSLLMAAPITLTSSLSGTSYLGTGSYTGVFDGSASLPAQYQINSATVLFSFSDDGDSSLFLPPQSGGSSVGNWYVSSSYFPGYPNDSYVYYARDITTYQTQLRQGEQESAHLSLEGVAVGSGSTSFYSTSNSTRTLISSTFVNQTSSGGYATSCGPNCMYYVPRTYYTYNNYNYLYNTVTTNDWYGSFNVGKVITEESIINQLLTTGKLDFSLDVTGDLLLTSARLVLDVLDTTPVPPAQVPEPSTALLMFAALGGMARRSFLRRVIT